MNNSKKNNPSAKDIFYKLKDFVLAFDADGQADLFDENGVWEFPFGTRGTPQKIVGREAIRNFGRKAMSASRERKRRLVGYTEVRTYETLHPDLIIVEFQLQGEVITDGSSYLIPFIQVIKVKDGKIILLRDYFSPNLLESGDNKSQ